MGVVYSRGQEIPVVDLSQFFFLKAKKIHPTNLKNCQQRTKKLTAALHDTTQATHKQKMPKLNCNRSRCTRCWNKSFGATPKNCEEWNPPLPHLIPRKQAQAPTVEQPKPSELFEEGMAHHYALCFKEKDNRRSRSMLKASASSGFPMAVACCHYYGINGKEQDKKKAFI